MFSTNLQIVRSLALSAGLVISLLATPIYADMALVVDTTIDSAALSICDPGVPEDCSVRGAVIAANNVPLPELVIVDMTMLGSYVLTIDGANEDLAQTGDLDILRDMTIRSENHRLMGGGTVLDDRVLEVHVGVTLTLEDLAIDLSRPPGGLHSVHLRNSSHLEMTGGAIRSCGSAVSGGGALRLLSGSTAHLSGVAIHGNKGFNGPGIWHGGDSLTIVDGDFRNNSAEDQGGAIYVADSVAGVRTIDVSNTLFQANHALDSGGAVWAGAQTEVFLTETLARWNDSLGAGAGDGGVVFSRGEVIVEGSTLTENRANAGAAIYVESPMVGVAKLDVVNSTLSANEALDAGGSVLFTVGADVEILNMTSVGADVDLRTQLTDVTVANTAFSVGCELVVGSTANSEGGNVSPDTSCFLGAPEASDWTASDLDLNPLGYYGGPTPTHLPRGTSPLVNRVAGPCLASDQRRFDRPAVSCDAGAVERQGSETFLFGDGFENGLLDRWSAVTP